MQKVLPKAKVIYDNECKKDNSAFVSLLGSLKEDAVIIEDDQFIADGFAQKSSELIQKHPNDVICFSQMQFDKKTKAIEGFAEVAAMPTFCLYIPRKLGNDFAEWYAGEENRWGKYYGNALLSYLLMIERRPYFIAESLTGHDISQASAIGHRKLYPSIGFDYGKALEKFCEIAGKNDPFKKLILMAKLCRFMEKRNALL